FMREKEIEVPTQEMNLRSGEHRTAEFRAKNPLGQVPVLELDDGTYVSESMSICRYLEEIYPERPLLGTTSAERAHIEVCQSQPVKMSWRPLRVLVATIIYLRGLGKREDIIDIDLLPRNDDFLDQALRDRLPIGKGETIEILA